MKTSANFILRKIEKKDIDQHSALLQNIGLNEKPGLEATVATVEGQ